MVTKKSVTKKSVTTKQAEKQLEVIQPSEPVQLKATLGDVVMVYTKGSSHWCALVQPQVVDIEGVKFLRGKQVTGKEGHRMEGKRTLIPFELVASIVEFLSEDDLWSAPQPKHLPDADGPKVPLLTSHEQGHPEGGHQGNNRNRHRRGRNNNHSHNNNRDNNKRGNDAQFQEQYDSKFGRGYNR
jgi:hypothetical protein